MENINIIVNKQTRMIQELSKKIIGNDGENLQENLVFSFDDEFVNGQARLELIMSDKTKSWIALTKVDETYQIPVKAVMTKTGKVFMQLVIDEGTDETDVPIFKSNVFYVIVNSSISAVEETPPSGYESWLEIANTKLNQMNNLDIDAEKVDHTTTITITKKDGTEKTTEVDDGIDGTGLDYNWSGTSLGVKREDESNYDYVDLKGEKGDAGAIKMIIVNELPSTGSEDTIYLVPLETPESQENNYAEYVYINGNWELLGKIGIQVDLTDYALKSEIPTQLSQLTDDSTHRLVSDTEKTTWGGKYDKPGTGIPKTDLASDVQTSLGKADTALQEHQSLADYVKNTDYATTNKGGVIKVLGNYGFEIGSGFLKGSTRTYSNYTSDSNTLVISKGTLENVIEGKNLTTKAYVDGLVGDISSAIDLINGESL